MQTFFNIINLSLMKKWAGPAEPSPPPLRWRSAGVPLQVRHPLTLQNLLKLMALKFFISESNYFYLQSSAFGFAGKEFKSVVNLEVNFTSSFKSEAASFASNKLFCINFFFLDRGNFGFAKVFLISNDTD